jgi:hypothetical protein
MELQELYREYKVRKLAFEEAKKEEEKYKALLKDAMEKAGKKEDLDPDGYKFERIVQNRQKIDEHNLLKELHDRGLTQCIKTVEAVDEEATLQAVERGELPQEVLSACVEATTVVVLKMSAPKKK